MFLTTSKHASKELQALARQLAAHLPQCRYLPRSERALDRLQTLASRAGEETILVVSSPQTLRPSNSKKKKAKPLPLVTLASRRSTDGSWAWQAHSLGLHQIKFGSPLPLTPEDDPLEIKISAAKPSRALADFLGLAAGKTRPLFTESTPVSISSTAKKAKFSSNKILLLQLDYAWC